MRKETYMYIYIIILYMCIYSRVGGNGLELEPPEYHWIYPLLEWLCLVDAVKGGQG